MNRKIRHATLLLVLLGFSTIFTCCGNHFSVQGQIAGLGNQNIHVIFASTAGVNDFYTMTKNDRFELKGEAGDWTVVAIFDGQNQPLATLVFNKGDNLKIKGDMTQRHNLRVEGNDLNEEWYQFRAEHASQYRDGNPEGRDTAIEKYVKGNPSNILSTVLLLFDYSQLNNKAKIDRMLAKLEPDAKPSALLTSYTALMGKKRKPVTTLLPLVLLESKGDFSTYSPTTSQASLLYLWNVDTGHSTAIASMKQLAGSFGSRLQVGDICLEPDSMVWQSIVKRDATTWRHYWAPEGPLNRQLINLDIRFTPHFVVTDSLGNICYNGNRLHEAEKQVKSLLR